MSSNSADESEVFKDLLSKIANNAFSKVTDKANALDRMLNIWNDENHRRELLNDLDDRKNLIEHIGYCVRSECQDNFKRLSGRSKAPKRTMFDIWKKLADIQLKEKNSDIGIDSFFETLLYLFQHNFEIWTQHEKAVWYDTLKISIDIINHYSLAEVPFEQVENVIPTSVEYFKEGIKSKELKDLYWISSFIYAVVKDIRLLQFSTDIKFLISHFEVLFVERFPWEKKKSARTVVLNIIYSLFVQFSHSCRKELLKAFTPLFRKLFPDLLITEKSKENDSSFNDSLIQFMEVFLACAYPKCCINVIDTEELENIASIIDYCTRHIKSSIDKYHGRNIVSSEDRVKPILPPHCLRLIVRSFIIQHNLMARSPFESNTAKRQRLISCLEEMLESNNAENFHYLAVYEEIFDSFESQIPSDLADSIVKTVSGLNLVLFQKHGGNINAYVMTLAKLLKVNRAVLNDETLKSIFNKALNWLHTNVGRSACVLLQHLLNWLPSRLPNQSLFLFDSVLKSICRLSLLSKTTANLLLFILRAYDFDECFAFRDASFNGDNNFETWKFRRQLITFLINNTDINVDYSDVLLSLLFIYPNVVQIDNLSCFNDDEIEAVENELDWVIKHSEISSVNETTTNKPISTAIIPELLEYMLESIDRYFHADSTSPEKARQIWSVYSIFCAKAKNLNLILMEKILNLQQKFDTLLLEVAPESSEEELLALDLGCYWEFSSDTARRAIFAALKNVQNMWKFISFWDAANTPEEFLNETVKRPRLSHSHFVGHSMLKLVTGKSLTNKIRLLRLYGKYLNQDEFLAIALQIRNDLDNEIAQAAGNQDRIEFLASMFSRELILNSNIKNVNFSTNLEFLLNHTPIELVLVSFKVNSENSALMLQWLNRYVDKIAQFPHQTAFFIYRLFKEISFYKSLNLLLTLFESIDEKISFYMPTYREFRSFVMFLMNEFQKECFDNPDVFPITLYSLRQRAYKILDIIPSDCILHLAVAIHSITIVLKNLKASSKQNGLIEYVILDLVAIGKCFCIKFLKSRPKDDSGLSTLIIEWMESVGSAIKIVPNSDWIGFMALDVVYDKNEEFPHLWNSLLHTRLTFILKYSIVLSDPSVTEYPNSFDRAYEEFQKGTLDCFSHPVIKSKLFWIWLLEKIKKTVLKKTCVAQLKLLWIFCPWLRFYLAQILTLFSEDTLRNKNHKVMAKFLDADDNTNIKGMASLLLYDCSQFMSDEITSALYNTIYQFHSNIEMPVLRSTLPDVSDEFASFMSTCFSDTSLVFKELKPFSIVALNNRIFAVFAMALMWRRREEQNLDTEMIIEALKMLLSSIDSSEYIQDYEVLFLSAVVEVFTYGSNMFVSLNWIRCLVKAGLLEEAFYYFKCFMDFQNIPRRNTFHIKSTDRNCFVRSTLSESVDDVCDTFMKIVFGFKDDIMAQGLPLTQQYNSCIRAFIAEQRNDWGIAAQLYEEIQRPLDASNALYHLGHKSFDLTKDKDNYRRVIDLSTWPVAESTEISYPKSTNHHNSTLYSLFRLTCRSDSYNLESIWKNRLREIENHCVVYPQMLNNCRDLKLLDTLDLIKRAPNSIELPEEPDLAIASSFLLAGWKKPETETADRAFDVLFSRVQKITLDRVRELRKTMSFQRAQTLIKVLESVASEFESFRSHTAYLELARLHLANNELNAARFLLLRLINTDNKNDTLSRDEFVQISGNQTQALLIAAEISDQSQKADNNFAQALQVADSIAEEKSEFVFETSLNYAKFAFKRYKEIDDYITSRHFLLQVEATEELEKNAKLASQVEERSRMRRELAVEREEVNRIRSERHKFLLIAAENFLRAMHFKEDKTIVPFLASLLIQNTQENELMSLVMDKLSEIPIKVWIPVQEVLTSYLFDESKSIQPLIREITCRLLIAHPYHCIYPLYFQTSSSGVTDKMMNLKRRQIISGILNDAKARNPAINELLKNVKNAQEFFREFGSVAVEDTTKFDKLDESHYAMRNKAFRLQREFKLLRKIPIPVVDQPLNAPNDVSTTNMITFSEINNRILKASGLSAPKVMEVYGSDGKAYKIIFKTEDLRQDSLVQLLFYLSNIIIQGSTFRSKKLRPLRTYRVVPMDRTVGLIEWCTGTTSLNDYLVGPNKSGGSHLRLRPNDMHVGQAMRQLANTRSNGSDALYTTFMDICNNVSPVFRYFFYESYVQPHNFVKHVQFYTDSLALWSIVCYVVGLGDRHLNNILIDKETGELVHIDLGMIFEYSKRALPIPEKVPFRLTRDMVDPILVEGVNARFKHVAIHAMEKLRENSQVIIGIASMLLHDPISSFGLNADGRNMLTETAISRLRSKLEGRDLSVSFQTVEQQVTQLINEAKDPKNLSQLFSGWMPFI